VTFRIFYQGAKSFLSNVIRKKSLETPNVDFGNPSYQQHLELSKFMNKINPANKWSEKDNPANKWSEKDDRIVVGSESHDEHSEHTHYEHNEDTTNTLSKVRVANTLSNVSVPMKQNDNEDIFLTKQNEEVEKKNSKEDKKKGKKRLVLKKKKKEK